MRARRQIVFRYADAEGRVTNLANPNGSLDNIAGVVSEDGNILGLMPHPERAAEPATGGTDGLALFRTLRRLAPRLPVILITSWPQADMSARVLREGAAAYLAKPWDDEQLVALASGLTRG